MCQALINLEISHEKLKAIVTENGKQGNLKEDIRMIKSSKKLGKNIKIVKEEAFKISAETFAKSYVYNIIDERKKLWLRNEDIAEKLGVQNIYDLIDEQIKGKCETNNPT